MTTANHIDIVDLMPALQSREVEFILDHLLHAIPAHHVGFWLADPAGDKLSLVVDRSTQGWSEHPGPVCISMGKGLVSKTYLEGSTEIDDGPYRRRESSGIVDEALNQSTACQLSVPFNLNGQRIGVMTAVQLSNEGTPLTGRWGLSKDGQPLLEGFAKVISTLIELQLRQLA
jgi:hypothetical protein